MATTLAPSDPRAGGEVSHALDVVNQLRRDFIDRDALYRDIDAVVFGQLPIDVPEAYRKTALEVRSPLAIHICTTITAALSINPYTVHFRPTGFGDAAQSNASLREHFFEASWVRQETESRRRLLRLFMWSLGVKGEAIFKTLERSKRAWQSYDVKAARYQQSLTTDKTYKGFGQREKDRLYHARAEELKLEAPYPISTTDVPPETFYYLKNEDGLSVCAEVKQVPYFDTLDRFKAGLDKQGRVVGGPGIDIGATGLPREEWAQVMRGTRTLTMVELWDWEKASFILVGPGQSGSTTSRLTGGTLVKQVAHGYGDPYLRTLKGPYFHAQGITTASRLPERAGLSVLFGFLRLFPLLDTMLTAQGNAGIWTAFPAFKRTLPPGGGLPPGPFGSDGTEVETDSVIEPGVIYPYDVAPIDQPRAGVEADKVIANIRSFLELALPSVVQGAVDASSSGYALNQAAHLARLSWDPIVSNAEQALGERTGFESWLIENRVAETVYAWGEQAKGKRARGSWLGIGPDDLKGVHRYAAVLDPETPSNKLLETRAIQEAMQARLITYEDAVEQAGANPDEVERSWMLHDLKNSDEIQQQIKKAVFAKIGLQTEQKVAAANLPPEALPGGPPGSTGPGAGAQGQAFAPGQGMPLIPTPPGAVTGMGPGAGPGPGGIPGAPEQPNPPANALPLPGQQ